MAGDTRYSVETIAAASRVAKILDSGCDRCDWADLDLLHTEGLMTKRRCRKIDAEHSDSLEPGDPLYEFNQAGDELLAALAASEPNQC